MFHHEPFSDSTIESLARSQDCGKRRSVVHTWLRHVEVLVMEE
jgi:hypothetical protein